MAAAEVLYSVVIPNWCGGEKVRRCVRTILKEARRQRGHAPAWTFEIIVCDDASPDGDGERLAKEFVGDIYPEIRIIRRSENGGFGPTVNEACAAAQGAILCLCNNDLAVQRGYFAAILAPLVDSAVADSIGEGVAAVSARTEDATGRANHACMRGRWEGGRMQLYWRDKPLPAEGDSEFEPMEAHFLQAGAAAVRTNAWRALGGLNDLFAPGYWEDYDFSHRLRAAGGRILYAPGARAYHLGQASMKSRFGAGRVRDLRERNRLLFDSLHAPDEERTLFATSVAAEIRDEWAGGGPFHLTKGLRLAGSVEAANIERASAAADLYPESAVRDFIPADR